MSKKPVIGIIGGKGKMGQWLTHFFKEKNFSVLISGRKTSLTNIELAKKADIVIVSVPISETALVLHEVIPHLPKTKLLADIASLKVMSMEAMQEAKCATLGLHPLFGPSVMNYQGLQIVFCRQKDNAYVDMLKNVFEESGIAVIEMSADEHDYQMAYIQALTHAVNLLFGKIVLDRKNELTARLHTPLFSLQSLVAGRVLQQDINMLAQVQLYNPYFLPLLTELLVDGERLLSILQKQNQQDFVNLFRSQHAQAKNFAHFATYQTNKILQLVSESPTTLPDKKVEIKHLPASGKVAFLGPQGTYSHLAATELFAKPGFKKIAMDSIFDLFAKVVGSEVDVAIVPAENSTEGTVRETLDYLIDFSVFVVGSVELPIHHQLLSKEKSAKDITTVVSHAQALAQCKNWLTKHLPGAKRISSSSTTGALTSPQKNHAYIASGLAGKMYRLTTLAENIEDNPNNTTRFYILAKRPMKINGINNNKTLLFLTVHNRVGILRDILDIFAKHNLNLAKLESRPSTEKIWDYHFFVEVEAKANDTNLKKAMAELEKNYCPLLRVLGQT